MAYLARYTHRVAISNSRLLDLDATYVSFRWKDYREKRLHKYMLDIEHIDHIADEMRAVVESGWSELAHKLPPKKPGVS